MGNWKHELFAKFLCGQLFSVELLKTISFLTKNIVLKQFITHAVWANSLVWLNLRHPLSLFFSFSVVQPTQIFLAFSKKKSNEVVKPFFTFK